MLKHGPVSSTTLAGILANTQTIDSDFELSRLLQQIVGQQALDDRTRPLFFKAASTIGSDFEHHRVLSAAIKSGNGANVAEALAQAAKIGSDFERAALLSEALSAGSVEGPQRAAFFAAVSGIDSSFERGRVLQAVLRRPDAGHDTILAALHAAKGMSGFELSQVLLAAAGTHVLTGDLRDAYIDAADGLGGFEQGQVMTALVKSERRR